MAQGAMTGRGFGPCNNVNGQTYGDGRGFGLGRGNNVNSQTYGYGRGFGLGRGYNCRRYAMPVNNSRDFLVGQKKVLEARLEEIDKLLS